MPPRSRRDERGIALIMALLLALLVASMAIGVLLMQSNTNLIARFHTTEAMMESAADAGLEQGRDTLNNNPGLIPVGLGFVTLETNAPVRDASGAVIPGFTRTMWAGPNGDTTGAVGDFASVIAQISNARGAVVVRRLQLKQDSFAKFARFFNTWSCCSWGPTEVIFGPVHSNQGMTISSTPGTIFWGPVTTVGIITRQGNATWNGGVTTGVAVIPFPTTTTLASLQTFATAANMNIVGDARATALDPEVRLDFVTIDMNGDGDTADDQEGYFRVFRISAGGVVQDKRNYVNGKRWVNMPTAPAPPVGTTGTNNPNLISPNCGGSWPLATDPFWTADSIYAKTAGTGAVKFAAVVAAMAGSGAGPTPVKTVTGHCYLGGDRRLYPSQHDTTSDNYGAFQVWAGWGGTPNPTLSARLVATGRASAAAANAVALTYWPLSRSQNISFKGVVFVTGSVGISGQVRGRVTVVAQGNVMVLDDIVYVQAPNTTCADIVGVLTTNNVLVSDNNVNTPFRVNNIWTVGFDDSPDELLNAFFLTLGQFGADNIGGGATDATPAPPENCGNTARGCKSIVGGTIQQGVAGTYSGTKGWAEQDTYDACGVLNPPPFYPTTGRYTKNRYYEIDPVGFNAAAWFAANQ